MIIYGTRGKVIDGKPVEGVKCPGCGSEALTTFGVIQYFHLYWIPFFPTSKEVGVECQQCKGGMTEENLPPNLVQAIKSEIFEDYNSLPLFSGLLILLLFLAVSAGVALSNSLDASEYIANPKTNDFYVVNMAKIASDVGKYKYGVFRVVDVNGDTIVYRIGNMGYKSSYDAKKAVKKGQADVASYYSGDKAYTSKEKIQKMKDDGIIRDVIRR